MLKSWLLKNTADTKKRSIENVENLREEKAQDVPEPTKIFASSSSGYQRPTKNSHPHLHRKKCIGRTNLINESTVKNLYRLVSHVFL